MKSRLFAVIAFGIALVSAPANAQTIVIGLGHAKDGDSLMVGDREVRLFGIDAPEFDQTCSGKGRSWNCGAAAADALTDLVTGKDVECSSLGKDQYGRILGRCTAGGTDINRSMVARGYAIAYRRYSSDYVSAEESAKASRMGVWAGGFELPEQFRRTGGFSAVPQPTSRRRVPNQEIRSLAGRGQADCNIKGNRNRKGEWIYHLPGMPYYDRTRPEEIFCTEAEAQAAGYRRAIVR